jgi:hypothetical protein
MKKTILLSGLFFLFLSTQAAFAQTKIDSTEISSAVPELSSFHKIIYPLWHKAYPAKDMVAFKALVPQIQAYMVKINQAKLSGILREKQTAWNSALKDFNTAAENYYKACGANDESATLLAAEKIHSSYEQLNRVVKPAVKEMDEYHQTLYVIFHKLKPAKQYSEMAKEMDKFIAEAEAITKYPQDKLTRRLGDKTAVFYSNSKELYAATVALKQVVTEKNSKQIDAALENVHRIYQKLDSIFK